MDWYDVCDGCGKRNDMTDQNTVAVLFPSKDWVYQHVQITCPCGYIDVIAMEPFVIIHLVVSLKLVPGETLMFFPEAGEAVKEAFNRHMDEASEQPEQFVAPPESDLIDQDNHVAFEMSQLDREWEAFDG